MTQELIYTSAPRGLKPGSRGFCTVAATSGIPPRTLGLLESLSGYRHTQTPSGGPHPGNPVVWSHLKVTNDESLLSRIADAGLDYSGRTNKLAHHVLVRRDQQTAAGPAAALMADGNFLANWSGDPRMLHPRELDPGTASQGICSTWERTVGDAGWAGVLAETASGANPKTCYLIVDPSTPALALIEEAISLLPATDRWDVTFSTYFTGLPPGMNCLWRCVLKGSPEHRSVPPHDRVVRIDLTSPLGTAPSAPLVEMARSGRPAPGPPAMPPPAVAASAPIASASVTPTEPTPSHASGSGQLDTSFSQDREHARKLAFQRAEQQKRSVGSEPPSVPPPRVATQPPRRGLRRFAFAAVLLLLMGGAAALLSYQPLRQQLADRLASEDNSNGSQTETGEKQPNEVKQDPSSEAGSPESADRVNDLPDNTDPSQAEPPTAEPAIDEVSSDSEQAASPPAAPEADPATESAPEVPMSEAEKSSPDGENGGDSKTEAQTPPTESPPSPDSTEPKTAEASEANPDPATTTKPSENQSAKPTETPAPSMQLTYLLDPSEWKGLRRQQNWTGDASPRSLSLSKQQKPTGVAIVALDTNARKLQAITQFRSSRAGDKLAIEKEDDDPLLEAVPVLSIANGELILESSYTRVIGDNFIAIQYENSDIELITLRGYRSPTKETMIRVPFDGMGSSDEVPASLADRDNRLLSIASIELAKQPPQHWMVESTDDGNTITFTRDLPDATITIAAQFQPSDPATDRAARLEVRQEYVIKEQEKRNESEAKDPPAATDPTARVKQELQQLKDIRVLVTARISSSQESRTVELARFRIQFE